MHTKRTLALALLAALTALAPPAATASNDVEHVTARIVSFHAGYGLEAWKDEPSPPAGSTPEEPVPRLGAAHRGVYANPYAAPSVPQSVHGAGRWGYDLTLVVEVEDDRNDTRDGAYWLKATIPTSEGILPAKLSKRSPTSFVARFDLDGDDGRSDFPTLGPGPHPVILDVYRSFEDEREPVHVVRVADRVTMVDALIDRPGFTVPESLLPGYADVGRGRVTTFHAALVPPNETYRATASFVANGTPVVDAPVEVTVVNGRSARAVWNGTTDADGRAAFSFEPHEHLGNASTGLLVLDAHLTGGASRTLATATLALPVSPHEAEIAGIMFERGSANSTFEPELDSVRVLALDSSASQDAVGARHGRLHVVKGAGVLSTAEFAPESFSAGVERSARYRADEVRVHGLESYGLIALFLTEDDRFYSFATASRGLDLALDDVRTQPRARANLDVVVRNFNDNFNGRTDPGLEGVVAIDVEGFPGGGTASDEATVAEATTLFLDIPLPASKPIGEWKVTVRATMGEITVERVLTVLVQEAPSALQKAIAAVPTASMALAPALLAIAALVLDRRQRDASSRRRR